MEVPIYFKIDEKLKLEFQKKLLDEGEKSMTKFLMKKIEEFTYEDMPLEKEPQETQESQEE